MELRPCDSCRVLGRPGDDVCWSCGRPPRAPETSPWPVREAPGKAPPAGRAAVAAALCLSVQMPFVLAVAELVVLRWAWGGALGAAAAAGFALGWRRPAVLAAAFAAGGAAGAAAVIAPARFLGFALVWAFAVALPFHFVARGFGWRLHRLPSLQGARIKLPALRLSRDDAPELREDEERIFARLREIREQHDRLATSRALLNAGRGGGALAEVREKLNHAGEVLQRQRTRQVAGLWEIEVMRWQRRLVPVVERHGGADTAEQMKRLAAARGEGERLLHALKRDKETAASPEGERCLHQLRGLLHGCDELREALVVQDALEAIRGIGPADDPRRNAPLSPEPLEALRGPDSRASLAAALAAFQMEHERLRDDDREARDVARFVRELERDP